MKFIKGEDSLNPKIVTKITNIPDASQAYNAIEKDVQFKFILDQIPYRYPAQLYEALLYIPVFLLLFFLYWKTDDRNKSGFLFGLFLVLLWSIRFGVEFVKDSQGGFEKYPIFNALSTGQWLSIPFIILGFYFIYQSTQNSSK
jgi:prolipoprotein diacylglyceryltransferase